MEKEEKPETVFEVIDGTSPFQEMRGTIIKSQNGLVTFAFLEEYHHLLADDEKIVTFLLSCLKKV